MITLRWLPQKVIRKITRQRIQETLSQEKDVKVRGYGSKCFHMLMVYMMHTIIHIFSHDYFSVMRLPKIFSLIKAPGHNTINIFNIRSLAFFIQNNYVFYSLS